MKLVPRNWRDFQHYKDRSPPWIRLQKSLLDNYDFHCLPVASRALAPMLWLVASDSIDGVIESSIDALAFRLRMNAQDLADALKPLIEKGFFETLDDASALLAERLRSAVPETEALQRAEASTEAKAEAGFAPPRAEDAPPKVAKASESKKTGPVWVAYSQAYMLRYGVEPVRNAKVNGQLGQFVDRIGADEAPGVATFFVGSQNAFYVRQMHPVDSLLKDAEKLRTEWATGKRVTVASAQQADRTQTNANAFAPLLEKARAMEATNG